MSNGSNLRPRPRLRFASRLVRDQCEVVVVVEDSVTDAAPSSAVELEGELADVRTLAWCVDRLLAAGVLDLEQAANAMTRVARASCAAWPPSQGEA